MGFDEKVVSFEELLMSQVVSEEALTRLLVERREREEFLETGAKKFLKTGKPLCGRVPPYPPLVSIRKGGLDYCSPFPLGHGLRVAEEVCRKIAKRVILARR
jgi:hypothetical protein